MTVVTVHCFEPWTSQSCLISPQHLGRLHSRFVHNECLRPANIHPEMLPMLGELTNWLEVWIFVSQLYLVSICFLFYGLSSLTRPSSSPIVTAPSQSHPQRLCTWCHHPIGPNSRLLRCDPSLVDVLVPLQHSTFEPASSVNNLVSRHIWHQSKAGKLQTWPFGLQPKVSLHQSPYSCSKHMSAHKMRKHRTQLARFQCCKKHPFPTLWCLRLSKLFRKFLRTFSS